LKRAHHCRGRARQPDRPDGPAHCAFRRIEFRIATVTSTPIVGGGSMARRRRSKRIGWIMHCPRRPSTTASRRFGGAMLFNLPKVEYPAVCQLSLYTMIRAELLDCRKARMRRRCSGPLKGLRFARQIAMKLGSGASFFYRMCQRASSTWPGALSLPSFGDHPENRRGRYVVRTTVPAIGTKPRPSPFRSQNSTPTRSSLPSRQSHDSERSMTATRTCQCSPLHLLQRWPPLVNPSSMHRTFRAREADR